MVKQKENITISLRKKTLKKILEFEPINRSEFIETLIIYGLLVHERRQEIEDKLKHFSLENINLDAINFKELLKK